jgi:hypothetical protein
MKCEYEDGLKVDYSGALHIVKGSEINVFMKEGLIPANIKGNLDAAARNFSCGDMRKAAQEVTETVGNRACIHE